MTEKVFEALGDPVRRAILQRLTAGEVSASDIVAHLRQFMQISQPAVSQHLKVLRETNLVVARADGNRRLYALDPEGIERARAWLGSLLDPLAAFGQPLDALATEVARGKRIRRSAAARETPDSQAAQG